MLCVGGEREAISARNSESGEACIAHTRHRTRNTPPLPPPLQSLSLTCCIRIRNNSAQQHSPHIRAKKRRIKLAQLGNKWGELKSTSKKRAEDRALGPPAGRYVTPPIAPQTHFFSAQHTIQLLHISCCLPARSSGGHGRRQQFFLVGNTVYIGRKGGEKISRHQEYYVLLGHLLKLPLPVQKKNLFFPPHLFSSSRGRSIFFLSEGDRSWNLKRLLLLLLQSCY